MVFQDKSALDTDRRWGWLHNSVNVLKARTARLGTVKMANFTFVCILLQLLKISKRAESAEHPASRRTPARAQGSPLCDWLAHRPVHPRAPLGSLSHPLVSKQSLSVSWGHDCSEPMEKPRRAAWGGRVITATAKATATTTAGTYEGLPQPGAVPVLLEVWFRDQQCPGLCHECSLRPHPRAGTRGGGPSQG